MSTETTTPATTSGSSTATTSRTSGSGMTRIGDSALDTGRGQTTIADVVVSKIAGIAAREVSGVHALGGGAARVVGSLRERIPGATTNLSQGVAVEVGEREAAVDVDIVAEYGVAIAELAEGIRQNVISSVERMTGLDVTEVNVTVHDVYLEDEEQDEEPQSAPRVR